MKRHHILRVTKGEVMPKYCIFYDTETKQVPIDNESVEHKMFLGVAHFVDYGSKTIEDKFIFYEPKAFWDWVDSKTVENKTLYIFAHNQDFDFRVTDGFKHLGDLNWFPHSVIFQSPPTIITFGTERKIRGKVDREYTKQHKIKRKYIKIIDSLNFFRESLARLGNTLGVEKLPMPEQTASWDEWITYCERDVIVLRKTMETFWEYLKDNNMGSFKSTLAAQSLNCFTHKYMKHEITIHTDDDANALERESYFGGRVECFRLGQFNSQTYYKLDINSMYPAVMRDNDYPVKFIRMYYTWKPETLTRLKKDGAIIANVTVNTTIPVIPFKQGQKLIFPVGKFTTSLCQPELELMDELNIKYTIHNFAYYHVKPIFKKFVSDMYKLRQYYKKKNNDQYQYMTKILMNSLYGKFGQKSPETEIVHIDETGITERKTIFDIETGLTHKYLIINGVWIEEKDKVDGFNTFVAIPSFVTSYARAHLARLILQAGTENVYYCDTDSLFTNKTGMENLSNWMDDDKLGYLKIEETSDLMIINNLKDYVFGSNTKIKGIKKGAEQIDSNTFIVETWEHFNGGLQRDRHNKVITKKQTKVLTREYHKGNVQPSGLVTPFDLYEESSGSTQKS